VLHTVQRVPVTGQLTYVPQSFFDEETAAHAKTARFFRDFALHYSKSIRDIPRPPGPGDPDPAWHAEGLLGLSREALDADPIAGLLRRTDFAQVADFRRLAMAALHHAPAARVLRPLLAQAGLSETTLMSMLPRTRTDDSASADESPLNPNQKIDDDAV
jgi:hypothetical protein